MDRERETQVAQLLEQVKREGDAALRRLTQRFDGVDIAPGKLRVDPARCRRALQQLTPEVRESLTEAASRIRRYHEAVRPCDHLFTGPDGELVGEKWTPVDSVGVYAPGGRAAYPSSVLMTVIPAQAAGVPRIAVASPPGPDGVAGSVLAACALLGVEEVYQMGGVQAVAAFAFGTETVKPVVKIVGPGNWYVTCAKKLLFGQVGIDLLAGPSEVVVLADESASPAEVAAELLAQAEHDPESRVFCFTVGSASCQEVKRQIEQQRRGLPDYVQKPLQAEGAFRHFQTLPEALEALNACAPEHASLKVRDPLSALPMIKHCGAVMLGGSTPVALGDYFVGPSHVLPTGRTARFASGLSTRDFMKAVHVLMTPPSYLRRWGSAVAAFARQEGLEAHARSCERQGGEQGE